jgi:hypothetical protein
VDGGRWSDGKGDRDQFLLPLDPLELGLAMRAIRVEEIDHGGIVIGDVPIVVVVSFARRQSAW